MTTWILISTYTGSPCAQTTRFPSTRAYFVISHSRKQAASIHSFIIATGTHRGLDQQPHVPQSIYFPIKLCSCQGLTWWCLLYALQPGMDRGGVPSLSPNHQSFRPTRLSEWNELCCERPRGENVNPRKSPVGMTLSASLVRLWCAEGCVLKGSKEESWVFLRGQLVKICLKRIILNRWLKKI